MPNYRRSYVVLSKTSYLSRAVFKPYPKRRQKRGNANSLTQDSYENNKKDIKDEWIHEVIHSPLRKEVQWINT